MRSAIAILGARAAGRGPQTVKFVKLLFSSPYMTRAYAAVPIQQSGSSLYREDTSSAVGSRERVLMSTSIRPERKTHVTARLGEERRKARKSLGGEGEEARRERGTTCQ
jgi:hypothetical protein